MEENLNPQETSDNNRIIPVNIEEQMKTAQAVKERLEKSGKFKLLVQTNSIKLNKNNPFPKFYKLKLPTKFPAFSWQPDR